MSATTLPRSKRRPGVAQQVVFGRSLNLFYLPAMLLFAVFTIYPVLSGFAISFTNWDGYSPVRRGVGLDNYLRLFSDPIFGVALRNTLIFGLGSTIVQQLIGLGLALVLNRAIAGRAAIRAIIYLPALVSPVVMGTMYYLLFQYNTGAFNDIVVAFGGERLAWLTEPNFAILVIVLVNSFQFVGLSMIIYLAGLQGISKSYLEAAALDGAAGSKRFFHIVLPLLQPAFATSIVFNLIGGLKLYDVIKVMTNGGPGYATDSVSTLIAKMYFDNQSAGYAAAQGVFLFLFIAVFTLALNWLMGRFEVEEG